nr:6-hydroxymethylpterin diphosphokinase MptE-like protein [Entomospira entomophilus]
MKPVVIIGAGLTLDLYRDWLMDIQPYYYTIAVDTAIPTLQQYGIIPDIVLVLESSPINLLDFSEGIHSDSVLIHDIVSHPKTKSVHAGRSFMIMSDFSRDPFYQRLRDEMGLFLIPDVGSVGIAAISLALRMTMQEIILCGLDFAYMSGKSHARGSYTHTLQLQEWNRVTGIPKSFELFKRESFQVEGQFGQTLWSDHVLEAYGKAIMQSDSQRIYALSSPYSMNLKVPLWENRRDKEYMHAGKDPILWNFHQFSEEESIALRKRESGYLEESLLSTNQECPSYLYLGYHEDDISLDECRQRAQRVYAWWGAE